MLNLRMSGESCLIFNLPGSRAVPEISFFRVPAKDDEYRINLRNLHGSRAVPEISFFRIPAKDDEYSINWRNNIVTVITRDTVMKAI